MYMYVWCVFILCKVMMVKKRLCKYLCTFVYLSSFMQRMHVELYRSYLPCPLSMLYYLIAGNYSITRAGGPWRVSTVYFVGPSIKDELLNELLGSLLLFYCLFSWYHAALTQIFYPGYIYMSSQTLESKSWLRNWWWRNWYWILVFIQVAPREA